MGDWQSIENMAEIGFPIAEAFPNGEVVITKHDGTGGRVSYETVAEQLVYEIGNPKEYITPDCVADFTSIKIKDEGSNRVKVYNVKGLPETKFYKVSCSYSDGYSAVGSLTYSWPQALSKAKAADKILRKRLEGGTRIALEGELPLNTQGGQLSAGRLHGYGFLHEACVQLWGEGGERQVAGAPRVAAVAAGGGPLASCMLLRRDD